ncbi:MAG: chemotaxis protein CheA [Crocinitomicaceae bacterium]|jgi:two-component system chemotaxis sensor kinase CheA
MDQMKAIYIQEANELLENLEVSLLSLEDNPSDKSNIEQVFRVMHTLKGNSSMFGLAVIAEFVHDLETIYDKIRQGEMTLSKEILNTTLASFDHLNKIIIDSELEDADNKKNHAELIQRIHALIHVNGVVDTKTVTEENVSKDSNSLDGKNRTIHISFEPEETFLLDGSNPLLLIAEIAQLGKTIVIPHVKTVDDISSFDPTKCLTSWDIFLETDAQVSQVNDVFVFAEMSAHIIVTEYPCIDLISNDSFNQKVNELILSEKLISVELISQLVTDFGVSIENTNSTIQEQVENIENQINEDSKIEGIKSDVPVTNSPLVKEKVVSSIRVSSDKLDELMNLVSELVTTQASLTLYNQKYETPELEIISENIEKLSRRLRDIAFGMTLVPINNMFGRFQRLVRDVSLALNKEVQFVTEGGETELDKSIIETLTDPLMHIIRNSLDHGLELPETREKLGKPRKGTVKLKAFYSGISVYIQIIDDGKGIDSEVIREKAISKGFMKPDDVLSDKEIFDFIFYPGFSTAAVVTDISGRGVGMDVVKRNITELKGSILVESKVNVGTTLTIKLPLSLSIIDGLLVDVADVYYIIPLSVVDKCYEVDNKQMMNNFNELLVLDDKQIPFINIRKEFGYSPLSGSEKSQIIVVSDADRKVGISVDHIVGEYQAVVKPIGKYYKNQDFISGATILGDGSIALVMDSHKIIDLYTEHVKYEMKS